MRGNLPFISRVEIFIFFSYKFLFLSIISRDLKRQQFHNFTAAFVSCSTSKWSNKKCSILENLDEDFCRLFRMGNWISATTKTAIVKSFSRGKGRMGVGRCSALTMTTLFVQLTTTFVNFITSQLFLFFYTRNSRFNYHNEKITRQKDEKLGWNCVKTLKLSRSCRVERGGGRSGAENLDKFECFRRMRRIEYS